MVGGQVPSTVMTRTDPDPLAQLATGSLQLWEDVRLAGGRGPYSS